MNDVTRLQGVKPDLDMIRLSTHFATQAMSFIGRFNNRMAMQFGYDGNQYSAHRGVSELAERLRDIAQELERTASDGQARAVAKFKEGEG